MVSDSVLSIFNSSSDSATVTWAFFKNSRLFYCGVRASFMFGFSILILSFESRFIDLSKFIIIDVRFSHSSYVFVIFQWRRLWMVKCGGDNVSYDSSEDVKVSVFHLFIF